MKSSIHRGKFHRQEILNLSANEDIIIDTIFFFFRFTRSDIFYCDKKVVGEASFFPFSSPFLSLFVLRGSLKNVRGVQNCMF